MRPRAFRPSHVAALLSAGLVFVAACGGDGAGSHRAVQGAPAKDALNSPATDAPGSPSAAPALRSPAASRASRSPAARAPRTTAPVPPAQTGSATGASWNPHVRCAAAVTTLARVLGTQRSAQGGATFNGGAFRPGIPDRRSFSPPCSVNGVPTLIELHRVIVGSCQKINNDGDWSCPLTDPNASASAPLELKKIHVETGANFRSAGGWSIPPGGRPIDIQGFVFWDPGHTTAPWHFYSGWEIHSLTAWRLAR